MNQIACEAVKFKLIHALQGPRFLLPAGVFYLVAGIVVMLVTNMAFHKEGRGTLAPWNAPK